MKEMFLDLNDYNHWAYRLILKAVRQIASPAETILNVFGHAVTAEHIWLRRMQGAEDSPPPVWREMTLDEIEAQINHNQQAMHHYISDLPDESFLSTVKYLNSKGDPFESVLNDIVTHVHLHAAYHRGQINKMIKQEDGEPAIVDYIAYKRLRQA